ncbi:MAG: flagellin [Alphaproteobacteria bacterium HGW-Alphaproteobacteria-8]|jgi:flagellin|nr:MAG: flagellin [Alphaproteobacteria bacterium HGW-Alphaproteobacteria-8]
MASILTNNGAITALQTLRTINQNLATTQSEVATGKRVANAKDNAAFFAISSVMQSDVNGFKAISDTLALGDATVGVARSGAETVTGLLNDLKGRIVAAQESNVDRSKIQADVAELANQTTATVDASQFNGLNFLKNAPGNPTISILGSLNRSAAGVTTSNINVDRSTLELASTVGAATTQTATAGVPDALTGAAVGVIGAPNTYSVGDVVAVSITNSAGEGSIIQTEITAADLLLADATALGGAIAGRLDTAAAAALPAGSGAVTFTNTAGTITANVAAGAAGDPVTTIKAAQGGGLTALSLVDVGTAEGAKAALSAIEGLIQTSVNAAASFGSAQKRIENQSNFINKVSDSLTSGIGALVDADLEAASARLQALQVQQQLGVQALSIANQQPQSILSLFR